MMNFKNVFLILLVAAVCLTCRKDDDNSSNEDSGRADHFSCNINGVPFQTSGNFNCTSKYFSYAPESAEGAGDSYFVVSGNHCPSGNLVGIRLFGMMPSTGIIDMTEPTNADSCSPFVAYRNLLNESEVYEDLISGTLNITEMYPRNIDNTDEFGRLTGTFEFKVRLGDTGDTLNVTNGSFHFQVGSFW